MNVANDDSSDDYGNGGTMTISGNGNDYDDVEHRYVKELCEHECDSLARPVAQVRTRFRSRDVNKKHGYKITCMVTDLGSNSRR